MKKYCSAHLKSFWIQKHSPSMYKTWTLNKNRLWLFSDRPACNRWSMTDDLRLPEHDARTISFGFIIFDLPRVERNLWLTCAKKQSLEKMSWSFKILRLTLHKRYLHLLAICMFNLKNLNHRFVLWAFLTHRCPSAIWNFVMWEYSSKFPTYKNGWTETWLVDHVLTSTIHLQQAKGIIPEKRTLIYEANLKICVKTITTTYMGWDLASMPSTSPSSASFRLHILALAAQSW